MPTNYVLIDFENVQPANLEVLREHPFKVLVFVGSNQAKVSFDLASAMQTLGEAAEYIKITGSGRNALDFHIAYYIGELAAKDSGSSFHIISRDTGFDPLIKHLKERKIQVRRERDLAEIPELQMSAATVADDEKVEAIVKNLAGRGHSRPRKVKTLSNSINSLFKENLTQQEMDDLLRDLQERDYIKVNDGRVSYNLPQKTKSSNRK